MLPGYAPFIDMFQAHFGFRAEEPDQNRCSRVYSGLAEMVAGGALAEVRGEEVAPLLCNLLSLRSDQEQTHLVPRVQRRKTQAGDVPGSARRPPCPRPPTAGDPGLRGPALGRQPLARPDLPADGSRAGEPAAAPLRLPARSGAPFSAPGGHCRAEVPGSVHRAPPERAEPRPERADGGVAPAHGVAAPFGQGGDPGALPGEPLLHRGGGAGAAGIGPSLRGGRRLAYTRTAGSQRRAGDDPAGDRRSYGPARRGPAPTSC